MNEILLTNKIGNCPGFSSGFSFPAVRAARVDRKDVYMSKILLSFLLISAAILNDGCYPIAAGLTLLFSDHGTYTFDKPENWPDEKAAILLAREALKRAGFEGQAAKPREFCNNRVVEKYLQDDGEGSYSMFWILPSRKGLRVSFYKADGKLKCNVSSGL